MGIFDRLNSTKITPESLAANKFMPIQKMSGDWMYHKPLLINDRLVGFASYEHKELLITTHLDNVPFDYKNFQPKTIEELNDLVDIVMDELYNILLESKPLGKIFYMDFPLAH
jgi:hypothetical protein